MEEDLLSQRIKRNWLTTGDHIYSWRSSFTYSHHGIFVGDGKVIHFVNGNNAAAGSLIGSNSSSSHPADSNRCPNKSPDCGLEKVHESGVLMSCLDCFLDKGNLYRFKYGVSSVFLLAKLRGGTCTTAQSDPPGEVVKRARYLLDHGGCGNYHLMRNNCEDFALYCKTGLLSKDVETHGRSSQANMVAGLAAVYDVDTDDESSQNPWRGITMAVGRTFVKRHCNDLGVRGDLIKVPVEQMASFLHSLGPAMKREYLGYGSSESRWSPGLQHALSFLSLSGSNSSRQQQHH